MKPYKAKSLTGAQKMVRCLRRQIKDRDDLLERWKRERILLAKLAADPPQFFNPLVAFEASEIRDSILSDPSSREVTP